MEFEELLRNLGLSLNEAKSYLAALELGSASAQEIAKKAGIIRTTAYSVLEGLVAKNFVFKTKEKRKSRYVAAAPENLLMKFANYGRQLQSRLPQLQAIYNAHRTKPKVVFFEGKDGIKEMYRETVREKPSEILEYNASFIFGAFPDYTPDEYVKDRKRENIRARRIAPDDENWRRHAARDKEELSVTKLLSPEDFNPPVEINIYQDKVAIMSYEDKLGLVVESKGIAKTMRQIYELLWKRLK